MSRASRVWISVALILFALIPWIDTIVNVASQNIGGVASRLPYESIDYIDDTVFTWRVYWHIVALIVFWVMLFLKKTITVRDKFLWAAGLFFLWPIISVAYVVKHMWFVRPNSEEL